MSKRDAISRVLFALSCLFFAFLYGFAAAEYRWFPFEIVHGALTQIDGDLRMPTAAGDQRAKVPGDPEHHKHPARHNLIGAIGHGDSSKGPPTPPPGVTLITSYWREHGWLPGVQLIDGRGMPLHHWHVDIAKIWPESPFRDAVAGQMNKPHNYVHGTHLFPNGDLLCCLEFLGLLRMNAKGEVLWRLDRRTHHAIHPDGKGNFWVCATQECVPEDVARRFPSLRPPFTDDSVLLVSPEGKVLREISVLELVYRSKHEAMLWTTQTPFPRFDLLHLNDVEPLSEAMAEQYPLFSTGDLLLSMKTINLVLVFDPNTMQIKWSAAGLFTEQHDPDFIGDGWISVFDNRSDSTIDGSHFGGSRLVAVRPHTGETQQIYPRPGNRSSHERRFHSELGGKAQLIANGHWLITEPVGARVFEIDQSGTTVWEWGQQRYDDGRIPEVHEGTRYAISPQTVLGWSR